MLAYLRNVCLHEPQPCLAVPSVNWMVIAGLQVQESVFKLFGINCSKAASVQAFLLGLMARILGTLVLVLDNLTVTQARKHALVSTERCVLEARVVVAWVLEAERQWKPP